jgi:hypothetical protein
MNVILCLALVAPVVLAQGQPIISSGKTKPGTLQPEAEQLLALTNRARAAAGAGQLKWDSALATAARQHCLRMAAEGPISHRYGGEADLSERAKQAGAHFGLIEENIAIGPSPSAIQDEWMHSPGHRTNLLNPEVDRVGMAVVASSGVLYAVADYERAVPDLTQAQVEAAVARLVRVSGITILHDPTTARAYCANFKGEKGGKQPSFAMRWQDGDLSHLPLALVDHLTSAQYHQATVGSCPAQNVGGSFSAYRVAVLLY